MRTLFINPVSKYGKPGAVKKVKAASIKKSVSKVKKGKQPKGLALYLKKKLKFLKTITIRLKHKSEKVRKHNTGEKTRPVFYKVTPDTIQRSFNKRIAYAHMINPHKKGKKSYKKGVRFMKNPIKGVTSKAKEILRDVPDALFAGGGFIGTNIVMNMLPVTIRANNVYRIGGKILTVIVLGMTISMLTKKAEISKMIMLGGTLNIIQDGIDTLKLGQFLPVGSTTTAIPASTETPTSALVDDATMSMIVNSTAGVTY